jgi:N-acetylglucosaminyl-diphospho-decaprenol L-rhamnosyltransferase
MSEDVDSLSAVVVNYRSAELAVACVASLRADGVEEIVVVDSASGDGVAERLAEADPACLIVAMAANRGYGAAANAGVAATSGPAVIICNADLVVEPGTAAALVAAFRRDERLGAVGPRIDRLDGSRYPSARAFPSLVDAAGHGFVGLVTTQNRWSRRYLRSDTDEPGPVDWISGACLAVRRRAWEAVGGFDEAFFMFLEDVDLCRRLHAAGWGVAYEPGGRVVHVEGASRASAPYRMIAAHHISLLRYGWRTGDLGERLFLPVVAVGLGVRTVLLCARETVSGRARPGSPSRAH